MDDAWAWVHSHMSAFTHYIPHMSAFTHYIHVQYRVPFAENSSSFDRIQGKTIPYWFVFFFHFIIVHVTRSVYLCWLTLKCFPLRPKRHTFTIIHYFNCGLPSRPCRSVLSLQCTHTYPVSVTHNNNIRCLSIGLQAHVECRIHRTAFVFTKLTT